MHPIIPAEVIQAFFEPLYKNGNANIVITPIEGGLINRSYRVTVASIPDLLLQQINKEVFPNPAHLQENYLSLWQYVKSNENGLRMAAPYYTSSNTTLFEDLEGNYWRVFEFIPGTTSYCIPNNIEEVTATAKAFAHFMIACDGFPPEQLIDVIPGFHDLSLRYHQFETALDNCPHDRLQKAKSLIDGLQQRRQYRDLFEMIRDSDAFPLRVLHHDAKIANVLFSNDSGALVSIIDLDTVMPGYFFSDAGDMIRSMICTQDENCTDPDAIVIRKEFYDAIINSYLEVAGPKLTAEEKKHIHYAGPLMIYMQALRFMTDYLEGDKYYQISYTSHNLDRAGNQLFLLQQLEQLLKTHYI